MDETLIVRQMERPVIALPESTVEKRGIRGGHVGLEMYAS